MRNKLEETTNTNKENNNSDSAIDTKEKLSSAFELLKGMKPNDENIKKLYEVKEKLGIRENDALWIILIIFESYNQSFNEYGSELEARLKTVLKEHDEIVKNTIKRADEYLLKKFNKEELVFLENYKTQIVKSLDLQPKQSKISIFNICLATFMATTIILSPIFLILFIYYK